MLSLVSARSLSWPRTVRAAAACLVLALLLALGATPARAQGIELTGLHVERGEPGLALDFSVRIALPRAVDEALHRGVPLYFVAQATVYRSRWYWRDARTARATRAWRLSYQPLADSWRVSLGGLGQTYATLPEALAALSSGSRWRIAEASQLEPDERYYVEFSYQLDTSQLPRPMQFGIGGQADWTLGVERTVKME